MTSTTETTASAGRRLSPGAFAAIVVIYLVIIQVGGRLIGHGISADDSFKTAHNLLRVGVIPIAISSVFAIAVATWLGWWSRIWHEDKPVQKWTRIIPISLLLVGVLCASWKNLLNQETVLFLTLVGMVLIVGFTEELMFRGIGLNMFRDLNLPEGKVALYSSLVFGAVHLSNALGTGGQAVFQAAVVAFTGYLLYLTRRAYLAIWPAMLVHSSQDFALISGKVGIDPKLGAQETLVILVMIILGILVYRRRHRIEPDTGDDQSVRTVAVDAGSGAVQS